MPKKKPQTNSLPDIVKPSAIRRRRLKEDGGLVPVDAVYHVPAIHPLEPGPWSLEADKIAWTDQMSGYGCIIRRSLERQHLCGYVSVPPGHPLFGRRIGSLTGITIGVHGGIDYSNACGEGMPENRSICHVASPGNHEEVNRNVEASRDDAWWFGFSCDQRDDIVPQETRRPRGDKTPAFGVDDPSYKTEAFVYGECVRLAAQLKAIEQNLDPRTADPGPTVIAPSGLESRR